MDYVSSFAMTVAMIVNNFIIMVVSYNLARKMMLKVDERVDSLDERVHHLVMQYDKLLSKYLDEKMDKLEQKLKGWKKDE